MKNNGGEQKHNVGWQLARRARQAICVDIDLDQRRGEVAPSGGNDGGWYFLVAVNRTLHGGASLSTSRIVCRATTPYIINRRDRGYHVPGDFGN